MDIGKVLVSLRKEHALTQEEFGSIFHVTRQTVSNWENGKNYPDLQTLVAISDRFDISLDTILRGDAKLVETIDRERLASSYRRGRHLISALSGGGVGLLLSGIQSSDSAIRSGIIIAAVLMIFSGWYKQQKREEELLGYLEKT